MTYAELEARVDVLRTWIRVLDCTEGIADPTATMHLAEFGGIIFIAQGYFSGGDSSRPADGDFIGLEVQADVAHEVYRQVRDRVSDGMLIDGSRRCPARCSLASASRSAASSR